MPVAANAWRCRLTATDLGRDRGHRNRLLEIAAPQPGSVGQLLVAALPHCPSPSTSPANPAPHPVLPRRSGLRDGVVLGVRREARQGPRVREPPVLAAARGMRAGQDVVGGVPPKPLADL